MAQLFDADELAAVTLRNDRDYFLTPEYAIKPLLPYLNPSWRIWEPACGEGHILRVLCANGFECFGTDILQGQDFFYTDCRADAIVTNPPYSLSDDWIQRCYALGVPFALLMPIQTLGGKRRQDLYRQHGIQVLMLGERVNFRTPTGREGKKSSPQFEVAWFCHALRLPSQITFATMGKR